MIFDIGGPREPVSIRDQIFGGRTLIERQGENRYVPEQSTVLLVGAGAAGVTAATEAASVEHDCPVYEKLEAVHQAAVDGIENDASGQTWRALCGHLDTMIGGNLLSGLTLLHACQHFSHCYALNRFVTLLLLRYLDRRRGYQTRVSGKRVVRVEPCGPTCAQGCYSKPHRVWFVDSSCRTPLGPLRTDATYDGIVLRHGIEPHRLLPVSARIVRQSLPYHLPR